LLEILLQQEKEGGYLATIIGYPSVYVRTAHLKLLGSSDHRVRYADMGLAGCKFEVGEASPAEDAERVRVAWEAAGPDLILMVDANQGYTRDQAIECIPRAGGYRSPVVRRALPLVL
jgi:L-alanine-DL-glutamate epimerase-like enolase superfamily enzyme